MKEFRNSGERISDRGDKLVVETEGRFSAVTVVDQAKSKGWSSLTITEGSPDLRRAIWLEGSMNGVAVSGYQATLADQSLLERLKRERRVPPGETITLRAEQVASDYARRVIPVLKRSYETFEAQRRKQAIRANQMRKESGNNRYGTVAEREVDNKLFYSKQALNKAVEALEYFSGLGRREIPVRENFEDGISRFVSDDLNRRQMLERDVSQNTLRRR